jgi:hypothetical protein
LNNRLPSPPSDFEGREVAMNALIHNIFRRRLVSLVGEDGVGKSSVAAAVCKYLADREIFQDSIFYLKAKGLGDYESFLSELRNVLRNSGSSCASQMLEKSANESLFTQSNKTDLLYMEEEIIIACLEHLKSLLVIDNLDSLLKGYGECNTVFRLFLIKLLERCSGVKILIVSTDTLSMHYIHLGVVEYPVNLGPLTLNSTLKLFARLAPSLSTTQSKLEFISALQPPKQLHVCINSADTTPTSDEIFSWIGRGCEINI